jgi:hypothetical protein
MSGSRQAAWATWVRLALFALPIALLVFVPVYLIDPYSAFGPHSIVSASIRENYRTRVNSVLFKVHAYALDPSADIILGDSQLAQLPEDVIDRAADRRISNMAYYGASLTEAVQTFWLAAASTHLRKVYFGSDFHLITMSPLDNAQDRVTSSKRLLADKSQYFIDHDVLEATWVAARAQFLGLETDYAPQMSREEFWKLQLNTVVKPNARMDPLMVADLRTMVDYCRTHGIQFVFVLPPQHGDVRKRIEQVGLHDAYASVMSQLQALADVWDCDVDSEITTDRRQFADPFHLTKEAAVRVAEDIWSDRSVYCRHLAWHGQQRMAQAAAESAAWPQP